MGKIVMIVDDNITNLKIGRKALDDQYNVITIPSGSKLFATLEKILPDIILLDVEMPEMNGYDVIRVLKQSPGTASIPVIFLTAKNDDTSEIEGLSLGAVDYITKPFSPSILRKRVETHIMLKDYSRNLQALVDEKTHQVEELQNAVLTIVAEIVEFRDGVTGGHIERTKRYLMILLNGLMEEGVYVDIISEWDMDSLYLSSLLHDVGKISVRDNVLMKPGRLTDEEFTLMKEHAAFGIQIIERIEEKTSERNFLHHAKVFAGTHHERWDGSGYPSGLAGEDIPLQGRLMAIADVYDALVSERPYKKAFSHEQATDIILESSGSHFDPALVKIFADRAEEFRTVSNSFKDE